MFDYFISAVKNMKILWKDVRAIIIDEISMVSYDLFTNISLRLNELLGKKIDDPEVTFGGISVIVTGDLYQIPPCHGRRVYDKKACKSGTHLWRD